MKKSNNDLQIIRIYEDLQTMPPRDPDKAAQQKALFLNRAAAMRARTSKSQVLRKNSPPHRISLSWQRKFNPVLNTILIVGIVIVALLTGTATTVYAAQDSVPGQSLYKVKTFSEDASLFLTSSSEKRLDQEIRFSDRRISEITSLVSSAEVLPEEVILRYEREMDQILELSSTMNDEQLVGQLHNIRLHAETQLNQVNALIQYSKQSEEPFLLQIRSRIQEQIQLCALGETDPQGFRNQLQQRVQNNNNFDNRNPLMTVTPSPVNNGQTSGQQGGSAGQGAAGSDSNGSGNTSQQSNGNSQTTVENQNNEDQIIQRQTPDARGSLQTATAQPGGAKKGH